MLGHCSSFYLGQEEPLEKEIVTHSSILAIDRGSWQTIVHGVPKSRTWWSMHAYTHTHSIPPALELLHGQIPIFKTGEWTKEDDFLSPRSFFL